MTRSARKLAAPSTRSPRTAVRQNVWAPTTAPDRTPAYGRGERLATDIENLAQSSFGHDFSGVRVHADELAARSSRLSNARAFSVGSHLVFGAGEYRPRSPDGQRLLAHELAHVVQQSRGGGIPDLRPGTALEDAADRAALRFPEALEVAGASGVGMARAALESVDVSKLGEAELAARAASLSRWFDDHLPEDSEYGTRLSLAVDVFVEMQARAGSPATAVDIDAFKSRLFQRSPRTPFELRVRRGELPQYHPVYEKGAVVGYKRESSGYYEIVDLDGKIVWTDEKPLETPLIDPIDLIPFELIGSLAAKATVIGVRAAAKLAIRVAGKEAGKVVVEEGVKIGSKQVAGKAGTVVTKELGEVATKEVSKAGTKEAGEVAGKELGKAGAGEAEKSAVKALVQVFRRGDKFKAVGAVSLKRLRNVLGRAGASPSEYKLVKVPKQVAEQMEKEVGDVIWGWVQRDAAGNVAKDLKGRPIINFTQRALSSLEQAVKTFGHEAKHIKDFAAGLTTSSEALAEKAGEKLWIVVRETVGK